ncbi:phosphatidylinositol kinase-related protein kinase tor1, partial [Halocaridina rubra]
MVARVYRRVLAMTVFRGELNGMFNHLSGGKEKKKKAERQVLKKTAADFTVAATKGFIRSISLSNGNSLQDTLRLLTVWFEHGHQPGVYEALVDGLKTIKIDTWLQ